MMKPADAKQTFSKLEAGTARHCPPLPTVDSNKVRLIHKHTMKPAYKKQTFSKLEAGTARKKKTALNGRFPHER